MGCKGTDFLVPVSSTRKKDAKPLPFHVVCEALSPDYSQERDGGTGHQESTIQYRIPVASVAYDDFEGLPK